MRAEEIQVGKVYEGRTGAIHGTLRIVRLTSPTDALYQRRARNKWEPQLRKTTLDEFARWAVREVPAQEEKHG